MDQFNPIPYKKPAKNGLLFLGGFFPGPHLANNLINLGIYGEVCQAATESGLNLQELIEHEAEPGLGSGGLGGWQPVISILLPLLEVPAIGYGIRYEVGIFNQAIENGRQVEYTDKWLGGNPWEYP